MRVYFECPRCLDGGYPLGARLGVAGRYSRQAERLMCLAAASRSYDISSARLKDLCGLEVSDTTIREIAQQHGGAANVWLRSAPEAAEEFRQAAGDVEFTTDGTSVNTTTGWREMKVGIFSRRERTDAATPQEWASRTLPPPQARLAFVAIENSESFGRLGRRGGSDWAWRTPRRSRCWRTGRNGSGRNNANI